MTRIEIKKIETVNPKDVIRLYREAGWWKNEYSQNAQFVSGIAKNSTCFIGAFQGIQMIGMGRAISDNVSDAYIQDVVVLSAFRNQGIGKEIVSKIIRCLKEKGVDWIGVISEPGAETFYENMGFSKMDNHVPMKLKE